MHLHGCFSANERCYNVCGHEHAEPMWAETTAKKHVDVVQWIESSSILNVREHMHEYYLIFDDDLWSGSQLHKQRHFLMLQITSAQPAGCEYVFLPARSWMAQWWNNMKGPISRFVNWQRTAAQCANVAGTGGLCVWRQRWQWWWCRSENFCVQVIYRFYLKSTHR